MSDDSAKNNLFNAGFYARPDVSKDRYGKDLGSMKSDSYATSIPIYDDAGNLQEGQDPAAKPTPTSIVTTAFVDGSDSLANKGMNIGFEHVPTGNKVAFKAFITSFNETYSSDWVSENVYGRGDPIHMFRNTSRNISLAWKIPAATEGEAYQNLERLQRFIQFLYPTYTNVQNASTINQSPLVRLKLMNLAQKSSYRDNFQGFYLNSTGDTPGLLGIIKNVTIQHNLDGDAGVFEANAAPDSHSAAKILPKVIEVNMDFGVIHEHTMGWDTGTGVFGSDSDAAASKNGQSGRYFPYNLSIDQTDPAMSYNDAMQSQIDYSEQASLERQAATGQPISEQAVANANCENAQALKAMGIEVVSHEEWSAMSSAEKDAYDEQFSGLEMGVRADGTFGILV